jgi:hypothetical protein
MIEDTTYKVNESLWACCPKQLKVLFGQDTMRFKHTFREQPSFENGLFPAIWGY